jgi:hypothetical protein
VKPEDPARLVSASASAELRRALGAARADLPSPDQVEAMLSRFPFPDGGGGGGGGGGDGGGAEIAAGAAKSAAIGKWLGGAFLAASAGVAFYGNSVYQTETPPVVSAVAAPSASEIVAAPTAQSAQTAPPAVVSVIEPSAPSAASAPTARPPAASASAFPSASASSGPVRSEVEILKEAQASRANPSRVLELVNEHARSHPKGVLGQEREVLRIEALVGLGKKAEAKALADAFRSGNPGSAYNERLNQIVPP